MTRRAFTLTETVAVIVAIALVIPGLVAVVRASSFDAIDSQRRIVAAWLASSVLESVQADAASAHASRGFAALDSPDYVTNPTDGLYARLDSLTAPARDLGLTYSVALGPVIDVTGAGASASDLGALREVTVTVSFVDQAGRTVAATFRTVVANL